VELLADIQNLNISEITSDDIFLELLADESEIEKMRNEIALTERAKALGVKVKFEQMLKAFKSEKKKFDKKKIVPIRNDMADGITHFNCEYDDLYCGQWICSDRGIYTLTMWGESWACPHPILITKILSNAETGFIRVQLAFKVRGKWIEKFVDKETISSASKIISLSNYGIMVNSENAKNLIRYLTDIESLNADTIVEQVSTSRLGWINGEFMPYGKNILLDNEQAFRTVFNSIKEHGIREKWYDLARKIRSSGRFEPYINLIASISSPIVEMVNGLPFIVDLYGKTGNGKTVSMMLASSVWANPSDNEYITDPKSTVTALELRLNFLNNFPMLIDDMAQLKNKYDGDFSELVYFLCSGKGKDRANQSLSINKSTIWKNVIIVNSEHSMITETMQGGAINRIIDIEAKSGAFFENGNYVVEILKENYGFCGKEFVDLLKKIGIDEVKKMQRQFADDIALCAKKIGVEKEEKQIIPMSILLTADKLATDHLFKDGQYLDLNYCVSLLKSKGDVSEDERAYEYIMSDVAININKFKPDVNGYYKGDCWGLIEDGYIIIMVNVFNQMAKRGNFSSMGFLSWAKEKGLLQLSNDGKNSKTKRLEGSVSKCVYLKLPTDTVVSEDGFVKVDENSQEMLPFPKM
jgi:putative DNA primase/helicase